MKQFIKLQSILFLSFITACNTATNSDNNSSKSNTDTTTQKNASNNHTQFVSDSFIVSQVGIDNSPYTSVQRMIGLDMVTINYHSINFYENSATGDIVKDGRIWMISDYRPMQFNTTSDFYVCNAGTHEGVKHHLMNLDNTNDHTLIKAGRYALYILPSEKGEWTLYFNTKVSSDTSTKLLFNYDSSKNIAAVKIKPGKTAKFEDQLFVHFTKTGMDSSIVNICFGNTQLPFKIIFKNAERLFSRDSCYLATVRKAGQPIDWDEYMEAAEDCSNNAGIHLDSALVWIDNAIKTHNEVEKQNDQKDVHTIALLKVKADVLAEMHRFNDAVECLNSVIKELNAEAKPDHEAIAQFQKEINNLNKFTKNKN